MHLYTPPYTPATNGIVERHNDVLKHIVFKLMADKGMMYPRLKVPDVLREACAAKNSVVRRAGFSS